MRSAIASAIALATLAAVGDAHAACRDPGAGKAYTASVTRALRAGTDIWGTGEPAYARLARRLHTCKRPLELPHAALVAEGFSQADIDAGIILQEAVGCSGCNEGYKGRTGIYQVMPLTESIAKIILSGGSAIQIADQARADGIRDLRASALIKARDGVTSLAEINRVTKD